MHGTDRAVSAVLGIVLLVGMVAIVSIGMLLVAGSTTESLQHESEVERAEQSVSALGQSMASAVASSDSAAEADLAVGESGAVAKDDTGWIRVESAGLNEPLEEHFGTIEYTADDGTVIAYEAGAVFRETGNQTRVVSAPPIYYDLQSETLSLPIIDIAGEGTLSSGDLVLEHQDSTPHASAALVEDERVTVTIHSQHYVGWQDHFTNQAGDTVVTDVDHDAETITVRLGHLELHEAIERSMVLSDGFGDAGNPGIDDDEYVIATMPELDAVIEEMLADAQAGTFGEDVTHVGTIDGSEGPLSDGAYYADEVHLTEELDVDLSAGNVTLLVDGNVSVDERLTVENWADDHSFKLYTSGHVDVDAATMCVDPCEEDTAAHPLQVFASSESHVSLGTGATNFEGLIYAASNEEFEGPNEVHGQGQCDAQVCLHSSVDFFGSIIASSVDVQGGEGSIDFEYDPGLAEADVQLHPDEYTLPPQLTYLNVAHHEVDIRER